MRNVPVVLVTVQPEGSPKVRVDVSERILSMEYEDLEQKADKLSLTIDNADLSNFDDPIWRKGNLIHIRWGYAESLSIPRICQIRKVIGFKELKIEALGKEVELNVETRIRHFEGRTRAQVARQIAAEWGFRDEALLHIQETKHTRDHIVQARMTDAQFMRRLAAKEGFEWYIDHDGFHFHERKFEQRTTRVLTYHDDPMQTEITDLSIENDVTRRAGSVNLKTHHPAKRRTIDVVADNSLNETQRKALGLVVDAPGKADAKTPGFKGIAHHAVAGTTETNPEAAKRKAAADLAKAQQMAVKMKLSLPGDPNINAKSIIEVQGIGKRLSQRYYVRSVTHSISGAYTIQIECVSDGSGGHSTKSKLAPEASAVQVGPRKVAGRKGPPKPRRSIDIEDPPGTPAQPGAPAQPPAAPRVPVTNADGSVGFKKDPAA